MELMILTCNNVNVMCLSEIPLSGYFVQSNKCLMKAKHSLPKIDDCEFVILFVLQKIS